MDPNTLLNDILDLSAHILAHGGRDATADDGQDLAQMVEDLNGWLLNGGFLPEAWEPF